MLGGNCRFKGTVPIPGNFYSGALILKQHGLFRVPVPAVPAAAPVIGIFLISQMLRHFCLKRPLEYPSG